METSQQVAETIASDRPPFPSRLARVTAVCFAVSVLLNLSAWNDYLAFLAIRDHGTEATARIVKTGRSNRTTGRTIALAWYDKAGVERRWGLTSISENFWQRISAGENLVVHEVKIRYLENNSWARPVMLDDLEERKFNDAVGVAVGAATVVLVLALAIGTLADVRAWSRGRETEQM